MINHLTLYKKLAPFKVTDDTDLPWSYQKANPQGRPFHDDWVVGKSTPRINTAFMVPLPLKKIAGTGEPEWVPVLNPKWTFAPGAEVKTAPFADGIEPMVLCPWVRTMTSVHAAGLWSRQAFWNGSEWIECYYTRSVNFFGSRFTFYEGLKIDVNPRDLMCWYPEVSGSIKWGQTT